MENIQSTLDKLASQSDRRISVFDIEIVRLQNTILTLSGRLLDETQLVTLSHHFPKWKLDTASIQILYRGDLPRMHVSTNLTGLYEKPTFGMPLSSELCYGTELEILDEQGQWVFTRQKDGYLGWAYKSYLTNGSAATATHLILAPSYGLRTQPDRESAVVTRVVSGTGVSIEEARGNWARVVANDTGWMPTMFLRPIESLPGSIEEKRRAIVEDSARMMGVPYLWGGTSGNGIDCSGLARLLHLWVGVDIPRDADMQHAAAKPVEPPFEVGDLLFFAESGSQRKITHVGISLGGWTMIHSSRGRNGVYVDDVEKDEARKQAFVSAGSFLR
ncbi:MAG TPA: NlpC/P60 family protein [Anaerolineales bacterium]|nr:NlpC/P60 family protein [Anaerolineales bacterium]